MPLPLARTGQSLNFHAYPDASSEGTLGDPEDITWSSIQHFCSRNVAEWMAEHVHGVQGSKKRRQVASNLKLYIGHAREFYEAAAEAKPNTAPLIYYYSFLNLAKGLCELRNPQFHSRAECYRHGLSWAPDPRKLARLGSASVSITRRGVWHALWEAVTHKTCAPANPEKIRLDKLFSLCPEVNAEYQHIFGDRSRLLDLKQADLLANKSEAWLSLSVDRRQLADVHLSLPALIKQISTTRTTYLEVAPTSASLRTIETATIMHIARGETPWSTLHEDVLGLNVFSHLGHDSKIQYFLPLQYSFPIRIPQLLVYYTILFWLGSLVRYDPHSVRWLMDSGYWILIDGFMTQSRIWLLELFRWEFYQRETTLWMTR